MKKLICRLFGHKDYAVCGGNRCRRCGRGTFTSFITKDALQALRRNMTLGQLGGINNKAAGQPAKVHNPWITFPVLAVFALAASLSAQVSNPGASVVATLDLTAQAANIAQQTLYTPTATGTFQVNAYLVVTQAATSSSTLPQAVLQWTDADANTTTPLSNVTATYGGNALGGTSMATGANSRIIRAKAGTNILINTTGYVSSGVTPLQYALHVTLTQIQ